MARTAGHGRRAALIVCSVLCALIVPAGAPAVDGVLWQGATPDQRTAFAVGVGRELVIPLEAAGPIGASTRIVGSRLPAGAVIEQASDAPAKAVLRWRPTASQIRDWTLIVRARAEGAQAPPLVVYVHVGRTSARSFRLSSVTSRSQIATLKRTIVARARPSSSSRIVTTLRRQTPEHVPHVLYLLGGKIDHSGKYWLRVRLPILPNGSSGWIPRDAVGPFGSVDTHLVIDRRRFRATLYKRGRVVFRSIVGVGEPRWPTPAGQFYIRERLTGFTDPIYGRLAFGTNGRSPVLTDWPGGGFIGIHGTNQPQILPGRVSHGCVRLRNAAIRKLDRLMSVGTPVTIR